MKPLKTGLNTGKENKKEIYLLVPVFIILIFSGTIVYHNIENWGYIDSFYFAVSTLTTVGYGDIVPSTDAGRIFTSFYILIGVSIFFYGLFSFGEHFMEERIIKLERRIRARSQVKTKSKTQEKILREILDEYHEDYKER